MLKLTLVATAVLALATTAASAQPGSATHPIVIKMKRGTDSVRLTGVMRQNVDCCTYAFKASAGQQMIWEKWSAHHGGGHDRRALPPHSAILPRGGV
jgi:hypothetical protein